MRSTRGSGSSCDKTIGSRNRASPKSHAEPRHCSLVQRRCNVVRPPALARRLRRIEFLEQEIKLELISRSGNQTIVYSYPIEE